MARERTGGGYPGTLANDLSLPKESRGESVAVLLGERSLQLDADFRFLAPHDVRGMQILIGPPPCLNIQVAYRSRTGPPVPANLRVPIAAGAEADAQRFIAWHRAARQEVAARYRPGIALRNVRLTRSISLAVVAVCGVMFASGMLLREQRQLGELPLLLAVIGAVAGLGALVMALIAHLLARSAR